MSGQIWQEGSFDLTNVERNEILYATVCTTAVYIVHLKKDNKRIVG